MIVKMMLIAQVAREKRLFWASDVGQDGLDASPDTDNNNLTRPSPPKEESHLRRRAPFAFWLFALFAWLITLPRRVWRCRPLPSLSITAARCKEKYSLLRFIQ